MQELKENIEKLSKYVFEDIQKMRSGAANFDVHTGKIGAEVMSLNALVNTYKAMNENG